MSTAARRIGAASLLHFVGKVQMLPDIPGTALPEAALDAVLHTRGARPVHATAARLDPPVPTHRVQRVTHANLATTAAGSGARRSSRAVPRPRLVHLADYAESRLSRWSGEEPP